MSKDGGPAFPAGNSIDIFPGMSLREYYAGQALVGLGNWTPDYGLDVGTHEARAHWACQQADAMIAELEKSQ